MSKNKKIIEILLENKKELKKLLKDQEDTISNLEKKRKRGLWEQEVIESSNYTIGYCTATITITKRVISLLKMTMSAELATE